MEFPQHRDRGNGGAGQIGRDVLGDGRQAKNVDVQHLARAPRGFEILAAVISQPEVQTLSCCRPRDYVSVAFELVADGRPDEIGPIRVEPFLHHQIDVTEVHIAEVDRDLLGVRGLRSQLAYVLAMIAPTIAIRWDGIWMVNECSAGAFKGPTALERILPASAASKCGRLNAPSAILPKFSISVESHEDRCRGRSGANSGRYAKAFPVRPERSIAQRLLWGPDPSSALHGRRHVVLGQFGL
jgi:hypothetical protein